MKLIYIYIKYIQKQIVFGRYSYDIPFLKTNGNVCIDDNRVGPLYKHVFPPQLAPHLSFVGIPHRVCKINKYIYVYLQIVRLFYIFKFLF